MSPLFFVYSLQLKRSQLPDFIKGLFPVFHTCAWHRMPGYRRSPLKRRLPTTLRFSFWCNGMESPPSLTLEAVSDGREDAADAMNRSHPRSPLERTPPHPRSLSFGRRGMSVRHHRPKRTYKYIRWVKNKKPRQRGCQMRIRCSWMVFLLLLGDCRLSCLLVSLCQGGNALLWSVSGSVSYHNLDAFQSTPR